MSDNTVFRATLFNQTRNGANLPVLSGHVSIPVEMIDELAELLRNQRTHNEIAGGMTIKSVRLPLSFWNANGRAPLAFAGESSFYTPQANATERAAEAATTQVAKAEVHTTPDLADLSY